MSPERVTDEQQTPGENQPIRKGRRLLIVIGLLWIISLAAPVASAGDDLIFYDGFEGNAPPVVVLSLTPANPQTTFGSVSVSWSVDNAISSCTPQDDAISPTEWESQGPFTSSTGSRSVTLGVSTISFSLTCNGPGGAGSDTVSINFGAPPELLITTNTDPVQDSTVLTFNIAVSNPSTVVRSGVMLSVIIPEFMTVTPGTQTSPPGVCANGSNNCSTGTAIEWNLGNLAPGELKVVRMSDVISSSAGDGDFIILDAQVSSDGVADVFGSKSVPVTEAAPALQIAITSNRDPATPGAMVSYEVRYSNRSEAPNAITADQLSVTLPGNVTLVSLDSGGVESGGVLTWPLSLAAGGNGVRGFTIQVEAGTNDGALLDTLAEIEDVDTDTSAGATHVLPVEVAPALDLNISSSVDSVEDSSVLTYTMTVANPGLVSQTNVVLEALIPGYMSIVAATETVPPGACLSGSGNCSTSAGLRWQLGEIGAGEIKVVHLSDILSSSASDGELVTLSARAFSDEGSDAKDSRTVVVSEAAPDLQLALTANRSEVAPGEVIEFSLRFSNRSVAPNAVVANSLLVALPEGLEFVSSVDGGTQSTDGISWDLAAASGSKSIRRFTARVAEDRTDGELLRPLARLQSTGGRAATATIDLAIQSLPAIDVEVIGSADTIEDSTVLSYTMTVSNPSSNTRTNVQLETLIPGYMSIVAGTDAIPPAACASGSANCSTATGLSWALGTLLPGESKIVRLSDLITSSASDGELLTLVARASADDGPDAKGRHVAVVTEETPDLQLGLTANRNAADGGDVIAFVLRASNRSASPNAVSANVLEVTLPEGVTFVSASDAGALFDNVISWPIALGAGADLARQFQVEIDNGSSGGRQLRLQAVLSADSANVAATADAVLVVDTDQSLSISATGNLDAIEDGSAIVYTMTITNPGASTQTNVVLQALIPGYMSIVAGTESIPPAACLSGSSNCATGTGLRWLLGDLDPGEVRVVRFADLLSSSADDGELLQLATRVAADSGSDQQDTHHTLVAEETPPLQLGIAGDRAEASPGDQVTYTLRYSNRSASPNALTADQLRISLPEGLNFVSATDGGTAVNGEVSWSLSLAAGANDDRQVVVQVGNGQEAGGLLPLSAVLMDAGDSATAVAETALAVVSTPALELSIQTDADPIVDGEILTMTLTVINAGAQAVSNVVVEFLIPGFMSITPASETSPPGTCLSTSSNCSTATGIRWNLGTLAVAESVEITITDVITSSADDGEILNINARAQGDNVNDARATWNIVILEDP